MGEGLITFHGKKLALFQLNVSIGLPLPPTMASRSAEDFRAFDNDDEAQVKLRGMREGEGNLWNKRNTITEEGKDKQEELVEALEDFEKATGIDEKKYIEQLNKCKSNWDVYELEQKFKKAGTTWYEMQIQKSGVFEPMDDREETPINEELRGLVEWFGKRPLYGDTSMITTLKTLDQDLNVKRRFREKLKKQSKFVRDEYFRRLGSLPLVGSKEQLLDNVLKEVKEVEDGPSAVQFEFKKRQKSAKAGKATTEIKKEVLEEFKRRSDSYRKMVLDNQQYFGGTPVMTPLGKIPEAAWEFIEEFEERGNFAEMQEWQKKLPSLIKQRKKLYDKRDDILKNALPKDRENLEHKTNRMRRHELEKFLPELEKQVQNKNIHTAEFMATILSARSCNVDLYQPLEKNLAINKFKLADFETQKAKLLVLREEIQDRSRVVQDYFSLPSYLRNDNKFLRANAIDREAMIHEAREQQNREQKEPFDASNIDHMGAKEIEQTEEKLDSKKGDEVMDDIVDELDQEGTLEAANIQENTYKKIFGAAKRGERHNETQKESYLRDLKFWVRMNQDIESENDIRTERERSKFRYIQAADEAYDLGYTVTSGGDVRKLEDISAMDLQQGNALATEKLDRARYGEHVMVEDHEGKMAEDPLELIERLSTQELMKLVLIAINKLGRGRMKLSDANVMALRNSPNIRKEIAAKIVAREMSHLTMDPANNQDHFINKMAA